jgi:hypothetical protein
VLEREPRAGNIGIKNRSVLIDSLFDYRRGFSLITRAIDRDVQTTKARNDAFHQSVHLVFESNIRLHEFRFGAERARFLSASIAFHARASLGAA